MDQVTTELLDHSPDSIVRLDLDGTFLMVNRTAATWLGHEREYILGKTNRELGVPETIAQHLDADLATLAQTKESLTRTFDYQHRTLEAKMVPELDQDKNIKSVVAYTRDISNQAALKETLESKLHFARELIKAIPQSILVLDEQLNIQSSNAEFSRRFHIPEEELDGKDLGDIARRLSSNIPDMRQELKQLISKSGHSHTEMEVKLEVPDEGLRLMLFRATQIDHMRLVLLTMQDITDHRRQVSSLEEDLQKRNKELTRSYGKLKSLLLELSETEDRERDKLSELLHDDLQQMLVGVGFHLKVLEEELPKDPNLRRPLAEAESLLRRSVKVTRDLSREMSPVGPRDSSVAEVLRYMAEEMKNLHGLHVDVHVSEELHALDTAVRTLLIKAVKEMLLNIVKHAEVKQATLEAGREKDTLFVWVKDHGRGFNPDEVLSKSGGGGLGLFSIQERLNALGGHLNVDSAEGRGSRFKLEIPIQNPDAQPPQKVSKVEQAILQGQKGPVRVVLVDDHSSMRQALAEYLDRHECLNVVGQASDGREGVEVVAETRPDVVLMDLAMPELSGVEATREIKSRFPDIRVVGLSLLPDEGISETLKEVGMDTFLHKSALLSEVFQEVLA